MFVCVFIPFMCLICNQYVINIIVLQPGRLIAHGRGSYVYNTAGNDVYIDGIGEDGNQPESLESNPNGAQDNMLVCPR